MMGEVVGEGSRVVRDATGRWEEVKKDRNSRKVASSDETRVRRDDVRGGGKEVGTQGEGHTTESEKNFELACKVNDYHAGGWKRLSTTAQHSRRIGFGFFKRHGGPGASRVVPRMSMELAASDKI